MHFWCVITLHTFKKLIQNDTPSPPNRKALVTLKGRQLSRKTEAKQIYSADRLV